MLEGRDIPQIPAHDWCAGALQVPRGRVFGRLTVRENLNMGAFRRRCSRADLAADLTKC